MEPNGILIYGELENIGNLSPVVLELVSKAVSLKEKLQGEKIKVCVIGNDGDYTKVINQLKEYGADEVIIVKCDGLKCYDRYKYCEIFAEISKKYLPRIILIGATIQGKEVASYTATKLETGLTADCTNLDITDNKMLLSTRPTFGGQLTANILCKTFPQMATVQRNTFKPVKFENNDILVTY
ncbi:electron transfer flavoprotein subunit alpha, partial [bacterium]|nr:electron transfer flavoprotein subunit alpha [bacterium]